MVWWSALSNRASKLKEDTLKNSLIPVLLRKAGNYWVFLSVIYIHRIMNMEALEELYTDPSSNLYEIE